MEAYDFADAGVSAAPSSFLGYPKGEFEKLMLKNVLRLNCSLYQSIGVFVRWGGAYLSYVLNQNLG
jgi:hypothetical protein